MVPKPKAILGYAVPPDKRHTARMSKILDGFDVVPVHPSLRVRPAMDGVHLHFGNTLIEQTMSQSSELVFFQSNSAGVDHLPIRELGDRGVVVSRCVVGTDTVARHAVMLGLMLNRNILGTVATEGVGYRPDHSFGPQLRRALLLGFGTIGKKLAAVLGAMNVRVVAVSRTIPLQQTPGVEVMRIESRRWLRELPRTDIIFNTLPGNSETEGLIGESELLLAKQGSYIVDVGRYGTCDYIEVLKSLDSGTLSGLAIDLRPAEIPIEIKHRLSAHPKVIDSGYTAGRYSGRWEDIECYFEAQATRWMKGEAPENIVAK